MAGALDVRNLDGFLDAEGGIVRIFGVVMYGNEGAFGEFLSDGVVKLLGVGGVVAEGNA